MARSRVLRVWTDPKAVDTTAPVATTSQFFSPCGGAQARLREVGRLLDGGAEVVCGWEAAALAETVATFLELSCSVQLFAWHRRQPSAMEGAASVGRPLGSQKGKESVCCFL